MGTSATTTGVIVEESRAERYYRRAGINGRLVRGSPSVRRRDNLAQISPEQLTEKDVQWFVIFPELIMRSKPWGFMGQVTEITKRGVGIKHLSGEAEGTMTFLPRRYFMDGRVYRKVL
jgi:hypothetical protein